MNTLATLAADEPESAESARRFFGMPDRYLHRNYRIPLRVRIVGELVGPLRDSRVLDLGCGDGSVSAQFLSSGNRITLVDYSFGMLQQASRNIPSEHQDRVEYIHSDISTFVPQQAYDLVLCIGVLSHVVSLDMTIEQVARCLKPGGRAVIQLTDDDQASVFLSRVAYAVRNAVSRSSLRWHGMTLGQVVAVASKHGLEVVDQQRHLLLPFPGMARLLGRWLVPYDEFTRRHERLARRGTNVILVCRKGRSG